MTLTPYALRCERLDSPLGIGTTVPTFSWRLAGSARDEAQTAHRLQIAELWDSGWVEGATHLDIAYEGPPPESSTRYSWSVSVRDTTGAVTTAESSFGTGILDPDEWSAAWIGRSQAEVPAVGDPGLDAADPEPRSFRTDQLEPPLQLRRSFSIPDVPSAATVHVTARGLYRLYVNGERVGHDELTPGWTDYRERLQYQTYDLTGLLRPGENVLAALIADGWWCGYVGFDPRQHALHYGTEPQFLAQLALRHADGTRTTVVTDESWTERPGAIRYSDLLMGESVDARRSTPGWTSTGFTGTGWNPAVVLSTDLSTLSPTLDAPVRVTETLPARSVEPRSEGLLVDFGENLVGRVRLTLRSAPAGVRIQIRHGEMLDESGELYTENLRTAEATDHYVTAGEPVEVFEPLFTTHGFRWALVTGHPGELSPSDISGVVLHSDTPFEGDFACSSPLVSAIQRAIVRGQRGNFVSVPTDCPQRDERLGWLADAQVFAPTASYNADTSAFYARWMLDVLTAQTSAGAFPDVAPLVTQTLQVPGAPAWGDAGVLIPWLLWRHYGDRRTLARSFDGMRAWVDYIHRHNPDLLWRHRRSHDYGDWLSVDAETPKEVVATAYFARSARVVAQSAAALGDEDSARVYSALADRIASAFCAAYVSPSGNIHGDTQTCYLLALGFSLLPSTLVPLCFDRLCSLITSRGDRLTTGFLGVALLAPVLSSHGRPDLAYALLTQTEYPSWGYSIAQGATSIWERWDGWTTTDGFQSPTMNSFNHYSLGSIGEWLYSGVAGIAQAPESVAWQEIVLRPYVGGGLTSASASYDSVRGLIGSAWSLSSESLHWDVTIPPGPAATVHVPTSDASGVLESGKPVPDVIGATSQSLVCRVPSGRHSFVAPYDFGSP